ncbi:hypothetical protein [uncultured Thiothrix sp.]|uniref:hypothetical protein n=1 Tax=uncultured Thiothrix sp. TaxID=223185 RepID=UPI002612E75F|nr:hypothetical protein [uncultured Thiothrix sp.]
MKTVLGIILLLMGTGSYSFASSVVEDFAGTYEVVKAKCKKSTQPHCTSVVFLTILDEPNVTKSLHGKIVYHLNNGTDEVLDLKMGNSPNGSDPYHYNIGRFFPTHGVGFWWHGEFTPQNGNGHRTEASLFDLKYRYTSGWTKNWATYHSTWIENTVESFVLDLKKK